MSDLILTCIQCYSDFVHDLREQKRFSRMGFDEPRRCPECRRRKTRGLTFDAPKTNKKRRRSNNANFVAGGMDF